MIAEAENAQVLICQSVGYKACLQLGLVFHRGEKHVSESRACGPGRYLAQFKFDNQSINVPVVYAAWKGPSCLTPALQCG